MAAVPRHHHHLQLQHPHRLSSPFNAENGWESRPKRAKEQQFMDCSRISQADFMKTGSSVSTGLGLSLDNSSSPLFDRAIDEELGRELQRMDAEIDHSVKIQGERLRQSIGEKFQAKQLQALLSVEAKILLQIQEKEAELEAINRKNLGLEEQMKQLSFEVGAWQQRATNSENMIAALKFNLQQVYAHQGKRDDKEGCGDSEVNDTAASCCYGSGAVATGAQLVCKEKKDVKDLLACKVCGVNEMCMLLLPCRHLCVCRDCESSLSFCPLCQSSKFIGMEVYM